jgi:protein-arginine kinase activator protein McsA
MKTAIEIREEIKNYKKLIKECFPLPEDYETRERIRAKINALKWVLEEE